MIFLLYHCYDQERFTLDYFHDVTFQERDRSTVFPIYFAPEHCRLLLYRLATHNCFSV